MFACGLCWFCVYWSCEIEGTDECVEELGRSVEAIFKGKKQIKYLQKKQLSLYKKWNGQQWN